MEVALEEGYALLVESRHVAQQLFRVAILTACQVVAEERYGLDHAGGAMALGMFAEKQVASKCGDALVVEHMDVFQHLFGLGAKPSSVVA